MNEYISDPVIKKINGETPRPELIVKGIGFLCKRSYLYYDAAISDACWISHLLDNMEVEYNIKREGNYIVIYINDYSVIRKRYDK